MLDKLLGIPKQRSAQFRFIEAGRKRLMKSARVRGIRLERVEFVVPFVEDDFGLSAWLFYRTRDDVAAYAQDGTSEELQSQLRTELAAVGYPPEWLPLVEYRFASKEEVDEEYNGRYYYYVK